MIGIHIGQMINGWWNWLLDRVSDIRYKKEFDARMDICRTCPNNKKGICSVCYCVLAAKTKAENAECPEGKWGAINGGSEE